MRTGLVMAFQEDPAIFDLLGDPVTQAVMRADRVDPRELEAMLRALLRPAGAAKGDSRDAEGESFDHPAVRRFLRSMTR